MICQISGEAIEDQCFLELCHHVQIFWGRLLCRYKSYARLLSSLVMIYKPFLVIKLDSLWENVFTDKFSDFQQIHTN